MTLLRLINWNIERRGPHTWQVKSLIEEIGCYRPDLLFLTEAHDNSTRALGGHSISHRGYRANHKVDSERLALLWSASPWEQLSVPNKIEAAGGAVLGRTEIKDESLTCLCLCIPYHMAKLPGETRTRPWHYHDQFLTLIAPWIRALAQSEERLIIAGDFNRRMPRGWGPKRSYELMERAFENTRIVTSGQLEPLNEKTIDHVAISGGIKPQSVRALSQFEKDGRPRSDHFGVLADLELT